jgi:uncharacterized protein with HEPN domain
LRDDRAWLLDILEALLNIEKYAAKGEKAFYEEELIQIWIIHHIQIAGEAANQLSDSIRRTTWRFLGKELQARGMYWCINILDWI